jgi:hypothetical protein
MANSLDDFQVTQNPFRKNSIDPRGYCIGGISAIGRIKKVVLRVLGRSPRSHTPLNLWAASADFNHVQFAQSCALGRGVRDEFTVACRRTIISAKFRKNFFAFVGR